MLTDPADPVDDGEDNCFPVVRELANAAAAFAAEAEAAATISVLGRNRRSGNQFTESQLVMPEEV
ncbi:hypothetical protein T265_07326 [Opisthorchis viverrini]|uniref:Uncharacterized protein n=1 Tax=Opisthorchis viverrini TaxID=6198 RepID=A0A075ABZ0_OPIVI|nr:hypothetical protein T265_07326 [Opisthorchis viverrini]KER25164.1 hypothetical protein T265_07326 [Opisthorchis viverrini]